jgi:hypothetical protein
MRRDTSLRFNLLIKSLFTDTQDHLKKAGQRKRSGGTMPCAARCVDDAMVPYRDIMLHPKIYELVFTLVALSMVCCRTHQMHFIESSS